MNLGPGGGVPSIHYPWVEFLGRVSPSGPEHGEEMKRKVKRRFTPKTLSMKYMERLDYLVADVERNLIMPEKNVFRKFDVWNFGDILADGSFFHSVMGWDNEKMLIQSCPEERLSDHVEKLMSLDRIGRWVFGGGVIEIHGWAKRQPIDSRKYIDAVKRMRWELDEPFDVSTLIYSETNFLHTITGTHGRIEPAEWNSEKGFEPWPDNWLTVPS